MKANNQLEILYPNKSVKTCVIQCKFSPTNLGHYFAILFMLDTIKTKEERHGFFWLFNHSMQERYRTLPAYLRSTQSPGPSPLGRSTQSPGLNKIRDLPFAYVASSCFICCVFSWFKFVLIFVFFLCIFTKPDWICKYIC